MIWVFLVLGTLVFPPLLIYYQGRDENNPSLITKTLGSVCFLTVGLLGFVKHDTFPAVLFVIALACGLLGDVLLQLSHNFGENLPVFIAGGAAFFLGHVFYITAILNKLNGKWVIPMACGLTIALILCLLFKNLVKVGRTLMTLGCLYAVFVISFACFAGGLFFTQMSTSHLLLFIGAAFFAASDMILICGKFGEKKFKYSDAVLLMLYYTGQGLIALSLSL